MVQIRLKELADLGWLRLEPLSPGQRAGTIVILLKRVDPDLPVFDPADDSPNRVTIDDIRDAVSRLRIGQKPLFSAQPIAPTQRNLLRQDLAQSIAPEE
jgi:hypothetical protein